MERMPGLSLAMTTVDKVLEWSATNSLWIFPMATSCCAIEFISSAAARVDIDQIGSVVRPTPRHCDVMIVAGTITVKMAPRVKKLWEQMPEPKWCIAMGSCAISGDFYRDIYSVVPGIDTVVPVDVYIPGCPPNADQVLHGLERLQAMIRSDRAGGGMPREERPETAKMINPENRRVGDPERDPSLTDAQHDASRNLGVGANSDRTRDARPIGDIAEDEAADVRGSVDDLEEGA
ncbi:MAG: NADH-quinone oxidoreductase subunit B [Deltaproteobacteria bacterium]|nr:MAG: NADH-quinone oxidoreductase subunit B [Deltaproteobacteria bacterium]